MASADTVRLHVHIPWSHTTAFVPRAVERRLPPELYLTGREIETAGADAIDRVGAMLADAGLRPSLHAPFLDLGLGATDPGAVELTRKRLFQAVDCARRLGAIGIVIHPGFDPYRFRASETAWVRAAIRTVEPVISAAETARVYVALENIFEERPDTLAAVVDHFSTSRFGHCFDTGHFNIFSKVRLADWLAATGARTLAMHIHDNLGYTDQHLPVGDGSFPFPALVGSFPKGVRWATMEMHDERSVDRCLANWTRHADAR